MSILEYLYNHVIRAAGASAIGISDVLSNEKADIDKTANAIKKENEAYKHIVERLFVVTLNYVENQMKNLKSSQEEKKEILKAIKDDCEKMIKKLNN